MSNDCPCEESLSILTNNNQSNNMGNNNMGNNNLVNQNINAMNNLGRTNNMMNSHNTRIVQNTNPINTNNTGNTNNTNNTNMEVDVPVINNKKEEIEVKEQIRIILYIVVALSIHEAIKYFIGQSIRLNKGSSSRYLYYPAIVIFALVLINIF